MVVGEISDFAIESRIEKAYARLSFRALGYFVIYIDNNRYGVYSTEATMLACSFDEVLRRVAYRGSHVAPFAAETDARKIVQAFIEAIYSTEKQNALFFGFGSADLSDLFYSNKLIWAPDGDEAFDDGSHILQFDVGEQVRLIGFKRNRQTGGYMPETLTDKWLESDTFYGMLSSWRAAFELEWSASSKIAIENE